MVSQIVSTLARHETGLRSEELRVALSVEKKELPRPLKAGLASGAITRWVRSGGPFISLVVQLRRRRRRRQPPRNSGYSSDIPAQAPKDVDRVDDLLVPPAVFEVFGRREAEATRADFDEHVSGVQLRLSPASTALVAQGPDRFP
jgi:hypothetical protein